ncbi:MAG: PASTA domain-containing protein, partial [Phaeodactylibacter sp.]|nr:PASTA domain-containing protein [Phaeodactylibacter sp.]
MKEKLIQFWNNKLQPFLQKSWLETRTFFSTGLVLKNLAFMLVATILIFWMTFGWLKCYTRHGESHQVHDYRGMNVEDAIAKATLSNFRIQVRDSIWRKDLEPNIVITQDPKPFSRVKENRTIYLKKSSQNAPMKKLPQLAGNDDYNTYKNLLSKDDIEAVIKEEQFNAKYAEGTIMYFYFEDRKITMADLKEGIEVPQGSVLEFVVTTKGGNTVELPDLDCLSFSATEFILSSLDLNVEAIEDPTVYDKA